MLFGLRNVPATFHCLMETVLARLAQDTYTVYLDNILVMGVIVVEHLQNLAMLFNRRRQAGLQLKCTMCHLVQKEIPIWVLWH